MCCTLPCVTNKRGPTALGACPQSASAVLLICLLFSLAEVEDLISELKRALKNPKHLNIANDKVLLNNNTKELTITTCQA